VIAGPALSLPSQGGLPKTAGCGDVLRQRLSEIWGLLISERSSLIKLKSIKLSDIN
jgi:hypothetical protein